jgi:hypothetical protein
MKITKDKLRKIIGEEVVNNLSTNDKKLHELFSWGRQKKQNVKSPVKADYKQKSSFKDMSSNFEDDAMIAKSLMASIDSSKVRPEVAQQVKQLAVSFEDLNSKYQNIIMKSLESKKDYDRAMKTVSSLTKQAGKNAKNNNSASGKLAGKESQLKGLQKIIDTQRSHIDVLKKLLDKAKNREISPSEAGKILAKARKAAAQVKKDAAQLDNKIDALT